MHIFYFPSELFVFLTHGVLLNATLWTRLQSLQMEFCGENGITS